MKGINYEVIITRMCEDYDSQCIIYTGDKGIGVLGDWNDDLLQIQGNFDHIEEGWDKKNNLPILKDELLYLSIQDLDNMKKIMEWWKDDCLKEPVELKRVSSKKQESKDE